MILAFCLLGLLYLTGLGLLLKSWHKAPEGFHDENHFYYKAVDTPANSPGAVQDDGYAVPQPPDTREQLHAW